MPQHLFSAYLSFVVGDDNDHWLRTWRMWTHLEVDEILGNTSYLWVLAPDPESLGVQGRHRGQYHRNKIGQAFKAAQKRLLFHSQRRLRFKENQDGVRKHGQGNCAKEEHSRLLPAGRGVQQLCLHVGWLKKGPVEDSRERHMRGKKLFFIVQGRKEAKQ